MLTQAERVGGRVSTNYVEHTGGKGETVVMVSSLQEDINGRDKNEWRGTHYTGMPSISKLCFCQNCVTNS